MAVYKAMQEKKKEMDQIKEHYTTLEKAIMALMKRSERNSVVVGDKELFMRYERVEEPAPKADRKAHVLQLLGNNMQNANLVWEAAHRKSGNFKVVESLELIDKQPFHNRAMLQEFK